MKPKKAAPQKKRAYKPRAAATWDPDQGRKQVVPITGLMLDAVVDSLKEGVPVITIANRTNFTPAQIREVQKANA